MDFILKGDKVDSVEYQYSVRFLHVEAVPHRPKPGVVDCLRGRTALPTGIQHHILHPPNRLGCFLQVVIQRAESDPEAAGALI